MTTKPLCDKEKSDFASSIDNDANVVCALATSRKKILPKRVGSTVAS